MMKTKIYGLIGYPLGHSFSQSFFNEKFQSEGINAHYLNLEIPDIGDLMEALSEYPELAGFNVTIPYKRLVMPYLDKIDEVAKCIGAVNVVKVVRDSEYSDFTLEGYNSDVVGFVESLRPLLKEWHKGALVLGTGGASAAVCYGLKTLGIKPQLVSRRKREGVITYDEITAEVLSNNKLIVNTTPLGMAPATDECPEIPYSILNKDFLCYDLIYNPEETLFMKRSAENGAMVKNGYEMLIKQALEAWRVWNEKR